MKFDPAPFRKMLLVLICLALIQVLTNFSGKRFWVNLTESEPVGLYRLDGLNGITLEVGDMVIMSIPDRYRQYVYGRKWLPAGWPLLKHVGALPGDIYCARNSLFLVNGVLVGPVYLVDSAGLPLPQLQGCREVPEGHFLPIATGVKTSFDGRYMGPVPLSMIRGVARPLWVF